MENRSQAVSKVVLSVDFEALWGVHWTHRTSTEDLRKFEQIPEIVDAMLRMLAERKIRATWACVTALACKDWEDYFNRAPTGSRYVNPHRGHGLHGPYVDPDGAVHFFPSLVERINSTLGQELGSHTFSHVSRYEKGFLGDDFFEADLAATSELHRTRFGRPPTSLVFPRNQVGALHVVAAAGIKIYRASPNTWMYSQTRSRPFTWLQRPLRLLDSLNPVVSRVAEVDTNNGLAKTPSSVFLRLNLPNSAWILHRRAIRRGLFNTRPGESFHIWWHPHNLVRDQAKSLKRVEETLDEIAEYLEQGKLVSNNMGDLLIEGGP